MINSLQSAGSSQNKVNGRKCSDLKNEKLISVSDSDKENETSCSVRQDKVDFSDEALKKSKDSSVSSKSLLCLNEKYPDLFEQIKEKNAELAEKIKELIERAENSDDPSGDEGSALADMLSKAIEEMKESQNKEIEEEEDSETESEKVNCCMAINAAKLARMLAAAKTKAQVKRVMELIKSDLKECDEGKQAGWDVDEASYKAAEALLKEAESHLGRAEDRDATPEEEMMSEMAALM